MVYLDSNSIKKKKACQELLVINTGKTLTCAESKWQGLHILLKEEKLLFI